MACCMPVHCGHALRLFYAEFLLLLCEWKYFVTFVGFWHDLCGMQLNSEHGDSLSLAYDASGVCALC